ncbi:chemotaxis protein, partial [Halohasta litorea]
QAESNVTLSAEIDDLAELSEVVDTQAESVATATQQQTTLTKRISTRANDLKGNVDSLESSLETFAASEWGKRINDHCRDAGIDWKQYAGTTLTFGMSEHMFTQTTEPFLEDFEQLTGIRVKYETYPEEKLFGEIERDLSDQTGRFDGFYLGLWPAANYHANGWVKDLHQYIDDA